MSLVGRKGWDLQIIRLSQLWNKASQDDSYFRHQCFQSLHSMGSSDGLHFDLNLDISVLRQIQMLESTYLNHNLVESIQLL